MNPLTIYMTYLARIKQQTIKEPRDHRQASIPKHTFLICHNQKPKKRIILEILNNILLIIDRI